MKNLIVLFIGLATALSFSVGQSSQTISLDEIHSVGLSVDAVLTIREGNSQKIKVSGPSELINDIDTDVDDMNWNIKYLSHENRKVNEQIEIDIQVKSLKNLAISGAGTIKTKGRFSKVEKRSIAISGTGSISFAGDADILNIALSGMGEMDINSNAEDMRVALSGMGSIELEGSVDNIHMAASGSGTMGGTRLKTKYCKATISGSSTLTAGVSDHLELVVSGSGQFRYSGNPKITKKATSKSALQRI